jgi:hypothetical protein
MLRIPPGQARTLEDTSSPQPTCDKLHFPTLASILLSVQHLLGMLPGEARSWESVFPQDWHVDLQ